MKKDNFYVCMGCGHEWEENNARWCPMCGCPDFAVDDEVDKEEEGTMKRTFNYEDMSIKNIEDNPHLIFISDGDKKEIIVEREEE